MSWSLARDEQEIALRFGGALATFWHNRYPGEGRRWVEGALELEGALKGGPEEPSLTRARALYSAAMVLRKTWEYPKARALFEESLRMYRALGDRLGIATSLHWMANLLSDMDLPEDRALAEKMYEESLEIYQAIGDNQGMAGVLMAIGETARIERDYPRAIDAYERSLALQREAKDKQGTATSETNLSYVLYHCGDYERAKDLLSESLRLYQEVGSAFYASWALFAWAGIGRAQGDPRKAATLAGTASLLAATAGAPFDPIDQQDREEIEAAVRADLSEDEWQRAQEEGRAMTLDEAVAYALGQGSAGIPETHSPL